MRIRQVKPDFWRDGIVGKMKDTTRLVYIGLWMVADDAGWFRTDVAEIGTDLFPYLSTAQRERKVEDALAELVEARRVIALDCGHAFVPSLTRHQKLAIEARRVTPTEDEHRRCVEGSTAFHGIPRHSTGGVEIPKGKGTVRNGMERNGSRSTTFHDSPTAERPVGLAVVGDDR